jgi:hypothetical protein
MSLGFHDGSVACRQVWCVRALQVVAVVVLASFWGGGCATSRSSGPISSACERGVCARLISRRALASGFVVEISAPANAALHNAWVVDGPGEPCRGGRALNAVETDAGVRTSGPLLLPGPVRLSLTFLSAFKAAAALDLDVRFPEGPVCLRLPLRTATTTDAAPSGGDGGHV